MQQHTAEKLFITAKIEYKKLRDVCVWGFT